MEARKIIADTVAERSTRENSDVSLRMTSGRELIIPSHEPRLLGWNKALALQQEDRLPVYIEYEPAENVVTQLLMMTPREVQDIRTDPSKDVSVIFRRSPSYYALKRSRSNASASLALLVQAREEHREVLVAVDPSTLEILYVLPGGPISH